MKAIIALQQNKNTVLVCDSAIIRHKEPFFIPEEGSWRGMFLIGARIDRLGKSIGKEFAPRYYSEIVSAVHPYDTASHKNYCEEWACDGALVLSDSGKTADLRADIVEDINRVLCEVSRHTTLKTGDLILIEVPEKEITIENGKADYATESLYGEPAFTLKVR